MPCLSIMWMQGPSYFYFLFLKTSFFFLGVIFFLLLIISFDDDTRESEAVYIYFLWKWFRIFLFYFNILFYVLLSLEAACRENFLIISFDFFLSSFFYSYFALKGTLGQTSHTSVRDCVMCMGSGLFFYAILTTVYRYSSFATSCVCVEITSNNILNVESFNE